MRAWLSAAALLAGLSAVGGYHAARSYAAGEETERWMLSVYDGSRLRERQHFASLEEAQRSPLAHQSDKVHVARVVREGPLPMHLPYVLPLFCASGHDGIHARRGDQDVYLTPLELKREGAYEDPNGLGVGFDFDRVWSMLSARFAVGVGDVRSDTQLTRVRFEEQVWGKADDPAAPGTLIPVQKAQAARTLTVDNVRISVREGANYLARHLRSNGQFDYEVDTKTGAVSEGYNLPRHAGTTSFVAHAARVTGDPALRAVAIRAANWLIRERTMNCGSYRCIGEDNRPPNLGSAALAALAYASILEGGADARIKRELTNMLNFMRSLQREDGEFRHQFDRAKGVPIDIQLPYFSGEAAYALAKGARITERPEDLEAAKRGLHYATRHAWSFFAARYLPQEEHWTCQTLAELWDRAPDEHNLRYCLDWHLLQQRLQVRPGEGLPSAVGAFGVTPLVAPRVTPAGSRGESAAATLAALRTAHPDSTDIAWLQNQLELTIAFNLQQQVRSFDALVVDSLERVDGGFPASSVDGTIRIDTIQHVGAAMLRWLELQEP